MREEILKKFEKRVSLINAKRFEAGLTVYKRSGEEYLSYTKDNKMSIEVFDKKTGEFVTKWKN